MILCSHLPCSLFVKENGKEFVKEYPFLLFSENADVSIFVEIQGYLSGKYARLPQMFLYEFQWPLQRPTFFRVVLARCRNL